MNWNWFESMWTLVIAVFIMSVLYMVVAVYEQRKGSDKHVLTNIAMFLVMVVTLAFAGMYIWTSTEKSEVEDNKVRHTAEAYLMELQKDGVVNDGDIKLTGSYLGTGERSYEVLLGNTRYRVVMERGNKEVKSVGKVEDIIVSNNKK